MYKFEDDDYLHIVNKDDGSLKIIDKDTMEVVDCHYKHKKALAPGSKRGLK